jgi:ABC-type glycerol-3-phosphate transport system permease component
MNRKHTVDFIDVLLLMLFFGLVLVTMFPLLWMLSTSFKSGKEAMAFPPTLLPKSVFLGNYLKIAADQYFPRYFLNSVIMSATITVISVAGSTLMGYVFAKFDFPCKNILFYAILITIMVPLEAYIVPLYRLVMKIQALNTYPGLIIPSIISSFGIFFMRQNMASIPDVLIEAARIDGAGNFFIFRKIIVPLSRSSISVLAILLFLTAWSDYLWPLLVSSQRKMYVLEIGLALLQNEYFVDYGLIMAGSVVSLVPGLLLFIFFRRFVMQGIALTGIKG